MTDPAIVAQLRRIEAKMDQALRGPLDPIVSPQEAMTLTGCKSRQALYRELHRLGIRPVSRGRYRRMDITNAQSLRLAALPKE